MSRAIDEVVQRRRRAGIQGDQGAPATIYDSDGSILYHGHAAGPRRYNAVGGPPVGFLRLNLGNASTSDPNSHLNNAITDGGNGVGLTFDLLGSWSSTDPGDGPILVAPARSIYNRIFDTGVPWVGQVIVVERTAPSLTGDHAVFAGFMNQDTDSGTVEMVCGGIRYTASLRNGIMMTVANGVSTQTNGGTNNSVRSVMGIVPTFGTDIALERLLSHWVTLDSAGATLTNGTGTPAAARLTFGTGYPRIFAGSLRTSSVAGTSSLAADIYYRVWAPSKIPT